MNSSLEIDGDALLLPIAVTGRIETVLFAGWCRLAFHRLRLGNRRRWAKMVRRVEVLGALQGPYMASRAADAKR